MPIADRSQRRAVAGVLTSGDKLLLVRRAPGVVAAGYYCFPGGMREDDESSQDAVVRELREELGLAVTAERLLWSSVTPWEVAVDWWLVAAFQPTPIQLQMQEVDQFRWVTIEQLRQCDQLLPSNQQWLQAWDQGLFELSLT